ncbi:MAG: DUF1800 domain-containing protein [Bacteroidota bacterium]
MRSLIPLGLLIWGVAPWISAQSYSDYLGAGHNDGITVTSSHQENTQEDGGTSVDGFPISDPELLADASRFLAQATIGYDYETIQMVAAMGYEAWLDEQMALPAEPTLPIGYFLENQLAGEEITFGGITFRSAWLNQVLRSPDLLRQRMNYALSQIFVVSAFGSDLFEDHTILSSGYFDLLGQHAFGNYRDLLSAVSRHLSMGVYLSHFNNPKSDPANNIHPDENYAREVMQLFSIGLYELNNDGTRQLTPDGNFIATYNNDDIREFAKVFTGFGVGGPEGQFGVDIWEVVEDGGKFPMAMYEEWHEQGEKRLLNGMVVPAGQTGLQDFEMAMDNLYQHPNVGPFIGKALIQFYVSSNPSPAYVNRVATVFNDNGEGVRGDMGAVLKAILLDPEARDCAAIANPTAGKLREPIVRYMHFLRAFNADNPARVFLDPLFVWGENVGQIPMYASSVFNFYQPEFQPNGPIAEQDLVAPVFQIHNSSSSIGYINMVNQWTFEGYPLDDLTEDVNAEGANVQLATSLDYTDEVALLTDPVELVDRLNILLAAGQLSMNTQETIVTALQSVEDEEQRLPLAIYLVLISPDFAILK